MNKEQEDNGLDVLLRKGKRGVECFNTGIEDIESMRMIKYRYEAITHKKLVFNYDEHYNQYNASPTPFPTLSLIKNKDE
jgi:hypothetical protein